MKLKKLSVLMASVACVAAMALPVGATTSWLDVKAGDTHSYYTYKDTGDDWDNYFYITPSTYQGSKIKGLSLSKGGKYSSGYQTMSTAKKRYQYKKTAPGGIYYRFTGSCTTSGWNLTGNYTP